MKRILIIKLGALGDVVMATALLEAIARHHVGARLTLLTTPPFAALFAAWPDLDVHARPRGGWRETLSTLHWIRKAGFARIYDLQGNDRSGLWCALSGVRERVGNHSRYPYTHHPEDAWRGQCHIFERMCAVLASAGIHDVAQRPCLPQSAADSAAVDAWLTAHRLADRSYALLHAGASPRWPSKRWPYFGELAARLETAGLRVVWLGSDADRAANASLSAQAGINATAEFSLPQLAVLGRRARFAVTNDSGPMHVLSASGIPLFGLFGPSDWRRNHALGQAARVLACVDIDPAFRGRATGDCLAGISVDAVWRRLVDEALV